MRRSPWRLIEWIAKGLAPLEREAVLGDLAESQSTFVASVSDLAGLTLRRAVAACREPRTAIAFFALALPLSVLLTAVARSTASGVAISLWFWIDNADAHLLRNVGFWRGVAEGMPRILHGCALLAFYGWSASTLARCVSRATSGLLCLAIMLMPMVWPLFPAPPPGHQNDAVFHLVFYRIVLPCLMQCVFVLLPALIALHTFRTENAR